MARKGPDALVASPRFGLDISASIRYGTRVMPHGTEAETPRFSGRQFTPKELALIREIVESCSGLSRKELAQTVCELLRWKRPSGALKAREC